MTIDQTDARPTIADEPSRASWPAPRPIRGPTTRALGPRAHGAGRARLERRRGGGAVDDPAGVVGAIARLAGAVDCVITVDHAPPVAHGRARPAAVAGDGPADSPARRSSPRPASTASSAGRSTRAARRRPRPPPARRPRPRGRRALDDAQRQRPRLRVPARRRRLRAARSRHSCRRAVSMVEMSGGIFGAVGTTDPVLAALAALTRRLHRTRTTVTATDTSDRPSTEHHDRTPTARHARTPRSRPTRTRGPTTA